MRPVDQLFDRYGGYHRHPGNKALHWVCVPLIVWSVLGLLWSASPVAAYVAIGAALAFYVWLSPPIALGMAALLAVMLYAVTWLGERALVVSVVGFVAAWGGAASASRSRIEPRSSEGQRDTRCCDAEDTAELGLDAAQRDRVVALEAQDEHRRGVRGAGEAEAVGIFDAQAVEADYFGRAWKVRGRG